MHAFCTLHRCCSSQLLLIIIVVTYCSTRYASIESIQTCNIPMCLLKSIDIYMIHRFLNDTIDTEKSKFQRLPIGLLQGQSLLTSVLFNQLENY